MNNINLCSIGSIGNIDKIDKIDKSLDNNNNNNNNNCQLIYSSCQMQTDEMDSENLPFTDIVLTDYSQVGEYQECPEDMEELDEIDDDWENSNDTIPEKFHYEIERGIDTGNIDIIKHAISCYKDLIDKNYIVWANSIIFQMVEEKMEDITLNF